MRSTRMGSNWAETSPPPPSPSSILCGATQVNQRKGLGVLGFKDGVVYHGQFVNDAPGGLAVETYPNGFGESSRSTGGAGGGQR